MNKSLTRIQKRIYEASQLDAGWPTYNQPMAFHLKGKLDIDSIEKNLGILGKVHPELSNKSIPLQKEDFSSIGKKERFHKALEFLSSKAKEPIPIDVPPFVEASLAILGPREYLLFFNMHLVAADSHSTRIFLRQISELYNGHRSVGKVKFKRIDVIKESKKGSAYWKKLLEGANFVLELPKTSSRPHENIRKGDVVSSSLRPALSKQLRRFAKNKKTDLFRLLQAAFGAFLYRYTGQEDFIIGYPVDLRPKGLDAQLGVYINTIPMRFQMTAEMNFLELLKQARRWHNKAKSYRNCPYEDIVKRAGIREAHVREPLFNVFFSMESDSANAFRLAGIESKKIDLPTGSSKFDLSLHTIEKGSSIHLSFEYPVSLQDRGFIERMAANFQVFLKDLITYPQKKIVALQLLTQKEKQELLKIGPGPKRAYPRNKSVVDVFEETVKKYPTNTALRFQGNSFSYEELNRKANQLARYLQEKGVKQQDFVGIYLERSIDLFVGILGILKAGAIYVPIDASYPMERKLYMINDTRLKLLITSKAYSEEFPKENLSMLFLNQIDLSGYAQTNLHLKIKPLDLAYVNYTSGTTGNPKGVQIYHRSINRLVKNPNWASFSPNDRFLQISNISFDALVHELWGALLNGATVCIYPQITLSSDELGRFIAEEKITQIIFTSRLFIVMVEEALQHLKGAACICSVGDAMSAKHAKIAFENLPSCQVINACGHTENTTHTTSYQIFDSKIIEHEVPIGRPIGNTSVYILDRNRQLVPFGANGELCTGGDGLAKGYLNRPDLTSDKFIPNPCGKGKLYRTGDLVRYLPDGNLSFLGRIDTQVKIRGFRIELSEIEETVRDYSDAADCIAMALEDVPGDKRLIAYVEAKDKKKIDPEQLRRWASSRLPSFMVPSSFIILDKFPMTPNGKVDRKALKAPEVIEEKASTFKTETEKTIAAVWLKILHRKSINRNDHFFKIGGDSIHAMQAASQIKRIFHCEINAGAIFQNPILSDLAAVVEDQKRLEQVESISKREEFSPIPLSLNEESLWLIDKLNPQSKLQYMVLYAYRIKGKIDPSKLQKSLEKIVHRHETLRTRFIEKDGIDLQWIEPHGKNYFLQFELNNEKEALSLMREKITQGMDLSQLPLFQALLFKVKPDLHLLAIRVHHIIFDVLSYDNLFKEWTALYNSKEVPDLSIQYGDYALWQRKRLQRPETQTQLEFWKQSLAGAPDLLEMPWDHPRPTLFTGKGSTETVHLPAGLSRSLKELASKEGSTPYVLLFAAFKILLFRYSGKEDLVVGTPFANRTRHELDPLIGYFLQMFVVRSNLSGNPSFSLFLSNLNRHLSDCYKNSDVPLEMIVNALNPERDPSFNPLFQTLFVYDTITRSSIRFGDAKLEGIPFETNTAKFDLTLFIYDREEGLECRLEYSTDLFEKGSIERMLSNFQTLLHSIVKSPDEKIGILPILKQKELEQIIFKWNEARIEYPQDRAVPELFEEMVKKFPDTEALRFHGKSMNYQQLNQKANQFARHLQKLGVKKQDFVGVYLERSDDLVVVVLAILKSGAVYVPIDASYPMERKLYMIEHTGLNVLVSQQNFVSDFPTEKLQLVCYGEEDFTSYEASDLHTQIDPHDLAYINYTSGSTGNPKGVQYPHLGIVRLLKNPTWMTIGKGDRMLQISNISFDMMAAEAWGALLNGATLCIFPQTQFSTEKLGQFLVEEQVSHLYLTARLFVMMVEDGIGYLKNVRFFSSTGEVMSAHHAKVAFEKLPHCKIVNAYGPTESHITTTHLVRSSSLIVPIGRPVQGTQVYIVDANFQTVPVGAYGELLIGGDGLALGYLKDPERTNEKFIPNPFGPGKLYRTGDLARYLPDGTIEYLGRIDTQVKILGFRIELDEVEGVIREYSKVADCVAIAKEINPHEKPLVVYIEPKEGETLSLSEIREYVSNKLPKHSVPSYFVFLDKFPLNPNGKIDKRKLPSPTATLEERVFEAPVTATEKAIAEIWCQLVRVSKVSRTDDFFHIGGHSILAMQLNSSIRKAFSLEVPVSLIFEYATLEKFADRIEQMLKEGKQSVQAAEPFAIWRNREVVLDPSIDSKEASPVMDYQYSDPKTIFLTGTTGFVGAFFLRDLLEKTHAKIYCLSRAPTEKEAMQRLIETMQKYLIWKPQYEKRIVAVAGNLKEPLLGLKMEVFQSLSAEIDSIFHFGAFVNHAMSYEHHKSANVLGTHEILRLASMNRLKPFHFISTVAVVEGIKTMPVPEDADIEQSNDLSNGYAQSKWVGEKLIHIARSRGMPCNIYRLPRVCGDSKIGSGPTGDFLWRVVQASVHLKLAPRVELYDDLTPVDYLCDAIRIISTKPDWIDSEFHVVSPHLISYMDIFKFIKKLGMPLELTDYHTWKKTLVEHATTEGDPQLQALASLLADQDLSQPVDVVTLASEHVHAALKGSGLKCPKIDKKLLMKYIDYYMQIGFLPPNV